MKHQPTRFTGTTAHCYTRNWLTINSYHIYFIVICCRYPDRSLHLAWQPEKDCHTSGLQLTLVQDIFLDEPVANGKTGELYIIRNTQFLKQTVAVGAGCFRAKTELR